MLFNTSFEFHASTGHVFLPARVVRECLYAGPKKSNIYTYIYIYTYCKDIRVCTYIRRVHDLEQCLQKGSSQNKGITSSRWPSPFSTSCAWSKSTNISWRAWSCTGRPETCKSRPWRLGNSGASFPGPALSMGFSKSARVPLVYVEALMVLTLVILQ